MVLMTISVAGSKMLKILFTSFRDFRHWIRTDMKNEFSKPGGTGNLASKTDSRIYPIQDKAPDGPAEPCNLNAVPAPSLTNDPVTNKLLGFLVRQVAGNYGIQIESIDAALFSHLQAKLASELDQVTCDTIIDDQLGGSFALASVEGHRKVDLRAGPPITCSPVSGRHHG